MLFLLRNFLFIFANSDNQRCKILFSFNKYRVAIIHLIFYGTSFLKFSEFSL